MKRLIAVLITMLHLASAQAGMLHYAEGFNHHSALLDETRQYSVYLPDDYEQKPDQHFPVLYLLDGEKFLIEVAGITQALRAGLNPAIPSLIIVAVHNRDRMRDYTPSHTMVLPNGEPAGAGYAKTGGGPAFMQYLTRELRPLIEGRYRTASPALLVGHSLGGLLALDTVARDAGQFQGYLSVDASLWFDYPANYQRIERALTHPLKHASSLFIAVANNPYTPGFGRSEFHRDHLRQFARSVAAQPGQNLHVTSRYFEEEDHHSVYHLAVYQGLQWLFRGYRLDLTPGVFTRQAVIARYDALNRQLGSELKPERENLMDIRDKAKRWPQMQFSPAEADALLEHYYGQ
ncbi:alpha/beta hydrolase [Aeromonas aquatica]|uniref:alpha/beta hydrolase n=1 Tax=Aeromonas aquatica TaxID=558964 RepID=UPI00051C39A2|nr:alpha/beta hydrolase-fold protein [Aeromonas aquatica]